MAYLKCPECGKENDELAKECKFCGAALNPPLNEPRDKSAPESVEDFLANLQRAASADSETVQASDGALPGSTKNESGQDISDFISRLKDFSIEQEVESGSSPETAEESLPDWIKELDSWQPTSSVTETGDLPQSSVDENILSLEENTPPQWLEAAEEKSIAAEQAEKDEQSAEEQAESHVLTDWLSAQKEDQTSPEKHFPEDLEIATVKPIIDLPPAFEELSGSEIASREPEAALKDVINEQPIESSPEAEIPVQAEVLAKGETDAEETESSAENETPVEAGFPAYAAEVLEETEFPAYEEEIPAEAETSLEEAETPVEAEAPVETEFPAYEGEIPAEAEISLEEVETPVEAEALVEAEFPAYEAEIPAEAETSFEEEEVPEEAKARVESELPVFVDEAASEAVIPQEETETYEEVELPDRVEPSLGAAETPVQAEYPANEAEAPEEAETVCSEAEIPQEIATAEDTSSVEDTASVEETAVAENTASAIETAVAEVPAETEVTTEAPEEAEQPVETGMLFYLSETVEEAETAQEEAGAAAETEPEAQPGGQETGQKVIILGEPQPEITAEEETSAMDGIETQPAEPGKEASMSEADLAASTGPEYPGEKEVLAPEESEGLVEWLGELQAEEAAYAEEEPGEVESKEQVFPEWEAVEKNIESEPAVPVTLSHPEYPGEEGILPPVEGENLDEWLGNLQAENLPQIFDTSQLEPTEEPSNTTPPFVGEDLEEWMKSQTQNGVEQELPAEEEAIPVPAEPLPEWVKEISAAESKSVQTSEEQPQETPVEAGLPAWLASLQPLEENLTEPVQPSSTGETEQTGPLAGIPGILPIFEASVFFRKPPMYSSHVDISDGQKINAAILTDMLEAEKQPVKKKRPERRTPHELLRTLVGILIIGAMLLPVLGIIPPAVGSFTSAAHAAETGSFQAALEALPADASVLIAVEYSPGYHDELSMAAAGTLELLMKRNARIAVVSTSPSGLILAEDLKNEVLGANPSLQGQYDQRDWFINLGYLPGEMLSLHELVSDPQQAAQYGIGSGLENRLVWDSAVLTGIKNLADFSMLVLVTDTIETGRAWIEQVQPSIPDVPFLIISSAQAAPMLKPYAGSGQVQGLISGMTGAISLQETGPLQSTDAVEKWSAYQIGVAAVVVLILIGILVEYIKVLRSRKWLDQEVS